MLNDLHIKYLKKILSSDANTYRSKIIAQTTKFAKTINEETQGFLNKGWEKREKGYSTSRFEKRSVKPKT